MVMDMGEAALSEENQSLRRLLDVSRMLAGPYDLTEMLGQIVDAGRAALHADRGTVFLYDGDRRELFVKIGTGVDGSPIKREEMRFSIDLGIAGECARKRCIINVPDCYNDARFNPAIDRRTGYRTRCLLTVPLVGYENELVGVLQMLNRVGGCFDEKDERMAEALASHAAVAIQRARLLDERLVRLKLERDLQLARRIQMDVLPQSLPTLAGYELAGFSRPAEQTGGDIYDVIPLAYGEMNGSAKQALVLLADATGHGVGPALSVTQVRAMVRVGTRLSASLDDLTAHVNNQLVADLAANRFVTAFLGVLDNERHELAYHAAGQGPLLHYHANKDACEFLPASTFPLGIMADAPLDQPQPMRPARGDFIVLLTDGFYEYQNRAGEQFGKERVAELVRQHRQASAQDMLTALLAAVETFAGDAPQMDDLTAVMVKRV